MPFKPEHFIDAMVQAARSHLPSDLSGAARAVGGVQKQTAGKALIKMFADASRPETPQSHPEDWERFRSYARDDVASMRDVFFATMPLTRREWREYHAVEAINHRGVPVDMAFVRQAVKLSALLTETSNADIARLTEGKVRTVNQSAALLDWIRYELRALPEVDRILTREVDLVEDEDGEEVAVAKMSLGRSHVEELIAYLVRLDDEKGLTDCRVAGVAGAGSAALRGLGHAQEVQEDRGARGGRRAGSRAVCVWRGRRNRPHERARVPAAELGPRHHRVAAGRSSGDRDGDGAGGDVL
jgi:hypothetical protein